MEEKKDNKKKIIILGIITIIIILLSTSFAFFVWSNNSNQNTNISFNLNGLDAYIHYNKGTDVLTGTLLPSTDYSGGISTEIELWKDPSAASRTLYGHIYLDITTIGTNLANEPALKWAITSNGEVLNTGDFVGKSNGNSIDLKLNIPLNTTKQLYQIYIWLDESMEVNDAIEGESISTIVRAEATEVMMEEPAGDDYIMNIFTNAEKTEVTNNNVKYQYAPSVGMMEDIGGNIRYYGADPNNYVSFNNELWRIIGVFKDIDDGAGKKETRLKIARNESIGDYQWDDNENEWSTATLNAYLNGTYLNSLTSEAQTMVGNAKWSLGGWNTSLLYANQLYEYERGTTVYSGRSTEWTGKIALMYPSDYMYAGDLSKCSKDGYNWNIDQANCRDMSWLRNTSTTQWTLTPSSSISDVVFVVDYSGYVADNVVFNSNASRPVLYLASTVEITGGDGTSGNPFALN